MTLDGLLPNIALMKSPWNWFVVGFSVLLLIFICHLIFRNKTGN